MIRLAHPQIPPVAGPRIQRILTSGMLTSGATVRELEERVSRYQQGSEAVLLSSGTTAALIGFHLLKERGARRVVMPDFCFPSVAAAAQRAGLELLLVDIDESRLSLDLGAVPALPAGPETVLLTIDQFGIPGPNAEVAQRVAERGWQWFEDAACALGSEAENGRCGTCADVSILSFHPRKVLTTAEGGAVVTPHPELASLARELRNLGLSGTGLARHFRRVGYNARLSELHAAVGLAQWPELDNILAIRRARGADYLARLAEFPDVVVPGGFGLPGANFQSMVVLLPRGSNRQAVVEKLYSQGVESTLAGFAISSQPAFAGVRAEGSRPHSRQLHERGLSLPLHEGLKEQDIDFVVAALQAALAHKE